MGLKRIDQIGRHHNDALTACGRTGGVKKIADGVFAFLPPIDLAHAPADVPAAFDAAITAGDLAATVAGGPGSRMRPG